MRIFVCALALAAFAGCGGTTDGSDGDVTTQVFGTWNCTAAGRANWNFTVTSLGAETTKHQWTDNVAGGGAHTAYVHLDELYLMDANEVAYRNFTYDTDASLAHLTGLDEITNPIGTAPYHCVK